MSGESVISVENLGKTYRINHQIERQRYVALRDVLAERVKGVFHSRRPSPRNSPSTEEFWALKDVSFEVKRGEVLGIIGRNGAGKSTLLKILSRITEPTEGRVRIKGRVASLLEVGTGFHPELTGRENIYLNGAILGMSRAEIKSKFDEIVEFADIARFIDTPVKRYSSGMYVRLAFAVAAHLEPEILIVDEVLAVGDAQFQEKCLGKMKSVSKEAGRTILFVSHNMAAIRALCSSGIQLRNGQICAAGSPADLIQSYLRAERASPGSSWERPLSMKRTPPLYVQKICARLSGQQPDVRLEIEAALMCVDARCPKLFVAVDLADATGQPLMQALPVAEPFINVIGGIYILKIDIDLPPLIPGRYSIDFWIGSHYTSTVDFVKEAAVVTIEDSPSKGRTFPHTVDHGHVVPRSSCEYKRLEAGLLQVLDAAS